MEITRDSELFKKVINNYWKYYRELEDEFLMTRRYVDFNEKNFKAFSVEYLKLYQAVCNEIDVIGKTMANIANPSFKAEDKQKNIFKWWYLIQDSYLLADAPFTPMNPTPHPVKIGLRDYKCALLGGHEFSPWAGFAIEKRKSKNGNDYFAIAKGSDTPQWWKDYNAVKHHRISMNVNNTNYEKANLGNVSNSFAALYILEKALMDTVGDYDDLQSFMDFSILFTEQRRLTPKEMDQLLNA